MTDSATAPLLSPRELGRHCFFAAMGGSGSTHLIQRLRERYTVGNKPDTVFRNRYPELRTPTDQGSFLERSGGYALAPELSLPEALPGYLCWVQAHPSRVTVLNTSAELGLLSALRVPGVVFLVRHPLHAYASIIKAERHLYDFEALGGPESRPAIDAYATRWIRVVQEALRLSDAGLLGALVRFEFAAEDAARAGVPWVFDAVDPTRRNYGMLSTAAEQYLRTRVWPQVRKLYSTWDV